MNPKIVRSLHDVGRLDDPLADLPVVLFLLWLLAPTLPYHPPVIPQ
jgi:hypothetical protein